MDWTPELEDLVRQEYRTADLDLLAAQIGCTRCALRTRANLLGVARRRAWTLAEKDLLRTSYATLGGPACAELLGRPLCQVYGQADRMRLSHQSRVVVTDEVLDQVRVLYAQHLTDTEIAARLGCHRKTVGEHRRALGLPELGWTPARRQRVRERTARQLERAGLESIGCIRAEAYRDFARRHGGPEDLRPRAVQILDLLAAAGVPLTVQQLALGVGDPGLGTRNQLLRSNDPEGTYLAHLAARGLVTRLHRAAQVLGQGRGKSRDLYCLGPEALAILARRAEEELYGGEEG